MMLCSLGGFIFQLKESEYEKLTKKFSFNFAKRDRIAKNPAYHSVFGWEESIEFAGTLAARPNGSLKPLIGVAKAKKPVQLVFASGESLQVIIQSIEEEDKTFMDNGRSVFIDFKIKVARYEA